MNVAVVGASGYSGLELIRIILLHPKITLTNIYAHSQEYNSILELFPHLSDLLDLPLELISTLTDNKIRKLKENVDVVFLATPSGVSLELGAKFLQQGFKVIDLSGDLRLKDPAIYQEWYGRKGADPEMLEQAVYGLSEWYPDKIRTARYIANPGCYATSILLALTPLFHHCLPIKSIVIDAKSGVSGAGRSYSNNTHFSEINNNFKTYKVGIHQHIPEIEQILEDIGGKKTTIQLITHLVPMIRGILSTIYVEFAEETSYQEINALYRQAYLKQPFIRLRPEGEYPETKQVYGTNYCDIGLFFDQRTKRLILFSVIDNLVKGAAGQAVQNLNLMMGWEQDLGLTFIPLYP